MAQEAKQNLKKAIRQLEHAEDYLDAAAGLLPEVDEEVERIVDDVHSLRERLAQQRLAG